MVLTSPIVQGSMALWAFWPELGEGSGRVAARYSPHKLTSSYARAG